MIDVLGTPTTAGSQLVQSSATPATQDAPCVARARSAGAAVVGKTNLVELAFGASGVNPWFGTPRNPLGPGLVPGGSSSGSAVAVATGEADVAYGTDTGGSIRIPSACCGTAGLKTTHALMPLEGVWPLAPSLDTLGPMAASVGPLVTGMRWLAPGFELARQAGRRIGRFRLEDELPAVAEAIDAALFRAGFDVTEVAVPGWQDAWRTGTRILEAEAARSNRHLLGEHRRIDPAVAVRLERGMATAPHDLADALASQERWKAVLAAVFDIVELLALPTLVAFPPALEKADVFSFTLGTMPVNLAGLPALSLPVPAAGPLPASLQLVAPPGEEDLLLATGLALEAATAATWERR
jgi:amidase